MGGAFKIGRIRTTGCLRWSGASTEDGVTFFDEHVVFSHGGTAWQGFANIVRRPDDGAIFLFSWAAGRLYVFRSDDGENFTLLTKEAYAGHDAMCVTWYPPFGQFLNYQTVTQPYPKRYPDNIGALRRVLSFRRSADGVRWESFSPSFLKESKSCGCRIQPILQIWSFIELSFFPIWGVTPC